MSELAAKATYQEIIDALKYTEYYPLLQKFDGTNLAYIENELDKMYYVGLFEAIGKPRTKDRKLFTKVVRLEVDVKNLINLFRLKKQELLSLMTSCP